MFLKNNIQINKKLSPEKSRMMNLLANQQNGSAKPNKFVKTNPIFKERGLTFVILGVLIASFIA